jgi:FixJ family two-component response regulator/signal transduction histidine kinase
LSRARDYATDVDEEPEKWRGHRANLEAHRPFRHFTYRTASADGSVRYIAASGKPVFDAYGRFLGYRGVSSDVTAAVRAEQFEKALHQAQAELTHVTRMTTLGEVTASFAHEVNQPLAAIVNNANACLGLLARGPRELDEVRDALGDIVSDAERASGIIQRVRALATRSPSERLPLRLENVVADVVALARTESAARRVTIRTQVPADLPVVTGDRVQLQQVLLNLLVNGMDAMDTVAAERRLLVIRGRADMQDGKPSARISVQDHGTGLKTAQRDRLFEAFYTTKPHGMGMGLAISRSIIEMHGGRLWVEPNEGPGATFSFSFPRRLRVRRIVTEAEPIVFVVDDDPSVRSSTERLVRSAGFKVKTFGSAAEFLESFRTEGPACLVLDVRLPGQSGLDLQRELAGSGVQIPVIFVTGHGDIPMSVRAMKAAVEFLTKPYRKNDLLEVIRASIAQDRTSRKERLEAAALRQRYEQLTPREREVVALVVAGLLNKQIADQLATSGTIKFHHAHIMQKMEAESLAELVQIAGQLGIAKG